MHVYITIEIMPLQIKNNLVFSLSKGIIYPIKTPLYMNRRIRHNILLIVLFGVIVASTLSILQNTKEGLFSKPHSECKIPSREDITNTEQNAQTLALLKGEELVYNVYYKAVRVGKSILTFHGEEQLDEKSFYHITFSTSLPGFDDVEEIYAYKDTFLPYRVCRTIKRMGTFPTRIEERYDQDTFRVDITKDGNLFTENFFIQKETPIYNAILLPYYYRTRPVAIYKEKLKVSLPMADFDVVLKGTKNVSTALGECSAYIFKGEPSKFTFWLSTDEKRIPIKIKSHTALDYSFVISEIGYPKRGT